MAGLAEALPDDVETLKGMLLAERARADRLSQILKELQRHRFGRRAEALPIDQLELRLEDVQQVEAAGAAEAEAKDPSARAAQTGRRRTNRGPLPAHLPRFERVIEPRAWPASAALARCIASARTSPSAWTLCPRRSECL